MEEKKFYTAPEMEITDVIVEGMLAGSIGDPGTGGSNVDGDSGFGGDNNDIGL